MAALLYGLTSVFDNPERKSPAAQAVLFGASFIIIPKTLLIKVFRWQAGAYVVVPGVVFDVELTLVEGLANEVLTTNAAGKAEFDFDAVSIKATPRQNTLPAGFVYRDTYVSEAKSKNFLTVTLFPANNYEPAFCMEVM